MAQGHLAPIRSDWLGRTPEQAIDPALPICDPHHHLWDHGPAERYLADDLLADTGAGHNVVSTVFVDCFSMYRKDGPVALKPVGETEWVQRLAQSVSADARTRVAAGIVGTADLTLGARVREVLEAHQAASPRFRGPAHSSEGPHRWRRSELQTQSIWREFQSLSSLLPIHVSVGPRVTQLLKRRLKNRQRNRIG